MLQKYMGLYAFRGRQGFLAKTKALARLQTLRAFVRYEAPNMLPLELLAILYGGVSVGGEMG
jgi:hypothetical protein